MLPICLPNSTPLYGLGNQGPQIKSIRGPSAVLCASSNHSGLSIRGDPALRMLCMLRSFRSLTASSFGALARRPVVQLHGQSCTRVGLRGSEVAIVKATPDCCHKSEGAWIHVPQSGDILQQIMWLPNCGNLIEQATQNVLQDFPQILT